MNPHLLLTFVSNAAPITQPTTEELRALFEQHAHGPPPDTLSVVILVAFAFVFFVGLSTIGGWVWNGTGFLLRWGYSWLRDRDARRLVEDVRRESARISASRNADQHER